MVGDSEEGKRDGVADLGGAGEARSGGDLSCEKSGEKAPVWEKKGTDHVGAVGSKVGEKVLGGNDADAAEGMVSCGSGKADESRIQPTF